MIVVVDRRFGGGVLDPVRAELAPVQQRIGYKAYNPIVGWAADRDPDLPTRPAPPGYTWPASFASTIT